MAYRARTVPLDVAALPSFLQQEFANVAQGASSPVESITLRVLYAQPEKFSRGMVVYADGTTWNPGAGEGLYLRTAAAWVKL